MNTNTQTIPVQIRSPSPDKWLLFDVGVKVSLDGKFLGKFSLKKGFNIDEHILPGEHTISTKIPIRGAKQFPFECYTPMILTLSYSHKWGDFSRLEITEEQAVADRMARDEEELEKQRSQKRQYLRTKAKERESALDYDSAIEIWEELGEIEEAARVRKLKAEQGSVKVDQTVVHGDYVDDRDTTIKDSVLNRSNVGAGSDDKIAKLEKIAEMKDKGIINDAEFKQMKKEILGK